MKSSTSSPHPTEAAGRLDVLVVDDDSRFLRTLADILRHRGYEPSTATTGREGLAVASRNVPGPAIALVDLALPDMTGLELVHELRRVSSVTEVVILTGNASLDSAVAALREHSYDYLIKPVPPDRLVDTLDRAGERWRRRRAEDALLASEERLRLLVENMSDVVLILDAGGTVTYASPSLQPTFGYSPEELAGTRLPELVHDQDADLVTRLVSSPPDHAVEIRMRRRDGRWGLFSCRSSDLRGEPAVSGLVFIARDVTEKRRLEAQALQAQKLDSIGRLAGGVAHDFNNLLSVVLGYSELVLQHPDVKGELRHLLEGIHEAGERGAALTHQLLAFARKQPAEPRVLDPNELVRELEGLLRRTLGEDVELVSDLDPGAGWIRADPAQVEQVLMNLAVNAREAMPAGGRLQITTRRVPAAPAVSPGESGGSAAGDFVVLSVADTGLGMSPEVQERLFEPFFTTKERGTGLGLPTIYGIVRQAGGHLDIESAPGSGSTVDVYLPAAEEASDPRKEEVADVAMPRGTETIFVVEDEPMVRRLVAEILESLGYRVLTAESGREALEAVGAAEVSPALLLSDVVLPGMDGDQLARRLTKEVPGLRVLLMSGYSDRGPEDAAGGPLLLQKPFTPGKLARTVRAILDAPVQRRRDPTAIHGG